MNRTGIDPSIFATNIKKYGIHRDNARLLVVEDNDFYRDFLVRHLRLLGYREVIEASDGQQAMDLIRNSRPDVVLLDIMMPVLDGYRVLNLLKAEERSRHIPVIIISTIEDMGSIIRCIELGAEDYLTKPVNPTLLRARLGACLERKFLRDREQIYLKEIESEKKRVDELFNIALPAAVASELKEKGHFSPRRYEKVAVLFCDVVRFTEYCDRATPEDIIHHVSELIESFENITQRHRMEKIKTIGDEFMATAGLLEPNNEPLLAAINCGLDMSTAAPRLAAGWQVRVGVGFGSVVGGIIGRQKYQFDVWGDTVNMAARVTRYGEPGVVVMTKETSILVKKNFTLTSIGTVDVKGKGMIEIVKCR